MGTIQPVSTRSEHLQWIDSARALVYKALARIFAAESDSEMIALLRSQELADALEVLCGEESAYDFAKREDYTAAEYAALFLGPGAPEAAPWESTYVAVDGLVMGAATLAVREFYSRAGFTVSNKNRVPDDHLATELAFLGELCKFPDTKLEQAQFLDEHLLKWVKPFVTRVKEYSPNNAYAKAATFMVAFLNNDRRLIQELVDQDSCIQQPEGNKEND